MSNGICYTKKLKLIEMPNKKRVYVNLLLPLLHSPTWSLLIFPPLLHLAISNRHWLLYVFPSVPQTGRKIFGQGLLHAEENKVDRFY